MDKTKMNNPSPTRNDLNAKILKFSNEIEFIRTESEAIKNELIVALKQNNETKFIGWAEQTQEMLLHTEQVVDVLRHDFTNFLNAMENDSFDYQQLDKHFGLLTADIVKLSTLLVLQKITLAKF